MTQRSSWENATGLSRLVLTIIVTLYLGFTALPSSATTFQLGDVFVAVGNGKVQHRDAAGNLLETLDTLQGHFTTGMAFDSLGNLYVANFDAGNIRKFDNMGGLIGTFGSGYSGAPESIVFDRNGNAYVGAVAGDNNIRKFDPLGNPVGQFAAATERVGTDWIDLAADQCTIFYTSEGLNVKRFDVCNNTQLINFNTAPLPGQSAFALRILPDGGVLVADTTLIARLNSSGQVVQTYTASGESCWFALNLDPDGKSFWSADFCSSRVHKFDIQSGTELLSFSTGTGFETVFGVVVFGELSASIVSISHSFGTQGETITNFAVNGTNFQPSSTLSLSGTGITVNSYSMRTPTLILASITIAPNAPTDPQDVTVVGPLSQQSSPSGPFTVLQAPSGQIVLTPRNAVQSRSVLLTPALPSTSCVNTDENSNPIKGTTGKVQLLARVRTAKGTPAQSVSVNFQVAGANPQTFITLTDKGGRAIFPYTGINKGLDTITVSATVGEDVRVLVDCSDSRCSAL